MNEVINAGTTTVQKQFRVNVYQACKAFDIKEGDVVEAWIKPVSKGDDGACQSPTQQ